MSLSESNHIDGNFNDIAGYLFHAYAEQVSPQSACELLSDGPVNRDFLREVAELYSELHALATRWNVRLAPHLNQQVVRPSFAQNEYDLGEDEIIRGLWGVSASNEGIGAYSGQILISIPNTPPGLLDFEGCLRAFGNVGLNTRRRSEPNRKHFGFPNFYRIANDFGDIFGCMLVPEECWAANDLPILDRFTQSVVKIRVANSHARMRGFVAALPTFQGNGVIFFSSDSTELRRVDIPLNATPQDRFRIGHDFAINHGLSGAFPTFNNGAPGATDDFACFKAGVCGHIDLNYSVAVGLGSAVDLSPLIAVVPYGTLSLPSSDAGSPTIRIPAPIGTGS